MLPCGGMENYPGYYYPEKNKNKMVAVQRSCHTHKYKK